mmetsp:Transcript_18031/g.27891  ORF Transcript_18031/g.27891 Transcript_18031/m.27891 type:complete len:238 (-) Transcript_18031:1970-2683(-)
MREWKVDPNFGKKVAADLITVGTPAVNDIKAGLKEDKCDAKTIGNQLLTQVIILKAVVLAMKLKLKRKKEDPIVILLILILPTRDYKVDQKRQENLYEKQNPVMRGTLIHFLRWEAILGIIIRRIRTSKLAKNQVLVARATSPINKSQQKRALLMNVILQIVHFLTRTLRIPVEMLPLPLLFRMLCLRMSALVRMEKASRNKKARMTKNLKQILKVPIRITTTQKTSLGLAKQASKK